MFYQSVGERNMKNSVVKYFFCIFDKNNNEHEKTSKNWCVRD